jgi:hypothetical protein
MTSIKALAVSVLSANRAVPVDKWAGTQPGTGETESPVPPATEPAQCESPHCAGCYQVSPGVWIHPPKCGESYREWLERWESKGKLQ